MRAALLAVILGGLLNGCTAERGPQGERGPAGPAGADGQPGSPGADGADGTPGDLRIYGDGSAGAVTLTFDVDWRTSPPGDGNLFFTDFTLASGATLSVPSGTVIRCTGVCRIDGTLTVAPFAAGGLMTFGNASAASPAIQPAHPGIAAASAGFGERHLSSGSVGGGEGGVPQVGFGAAYSLPLVGVIGGGGGGGGGGGYTGYRGSNGGGRVTLLGKQGVSVGGAIQANGDSNVTPGTGGGGGGLIVLASAVEVLHTGTLSANGGTGGPSAASTSAGGGGGGGLIQLIAPTIDNSGTTTVTAGGHGAVGAPGSVSTSGRSGGGGGGGSRGYGGGGGAVSGNDPLAPVFGPTDGQVLLRRMDPGPLF